MKARLATVILAGAAMLALLSGCQSSGPRLRGDELVAAVEVAGPDCSGGAVADLPAPGERTLRLITKCDPADKTCEKALVRVLLGRRDGKPLGTLGQLVAPGGVLKFRAYRDPATQGIPPYTSPYFCLVLQHADGTRSRLLWESAYNGYMGAKNPPFPVGQWVALDILNGIYWPQTEPVNFNMGAGFQPLSKFVAGHRITRKDGQVSPQYGPETPVVAVGVGSGSGLPGYLLAYVDDIEIGFAGGTTYRATFDR